MAIQKIVFTSVIMLGLAVFGGIKTGAAAEMTGTMVAQKAFDREDGRTMQATGVMTLVNSNGKQKTRKYFLYSKDYGKRIKSLTRFTAPADIAGTSFLSWDNDETDDQFIYLPALKRVRRIVSTQKDGQFVNSDITYEDMERREVNLDKHILVKTISTKQYKVVYVIKSIPNEPQKSQYSYRLSWVAQDLDYLPIRGEFYDKHNKLAKIFELQSAKKISNIWTSTQIVFSDLKRKHKTVVTMAEIKYNQPIADSYFTKSALESY